MTAGSGTAARRHRRAPRALSGAAAFFGLAVLAGSPVAAADPGWASPWAVNDQLQLRLVSAQAALGAEGVARLGLEIHLAPGWAFYWRNPGDNGLPPLLDWSASRNAADIEVAWPAPHRKEVQGAQNYVYTDEVLLPVTVAAADPEEPLTVELSLDYGVCKDVCVPYSDRLTLRLPAGAAVATPGSAIIDWYADLVPAPAAAAGVTLAAALPRADAGRLRLQASAASPFVAPDLFVEGPEGIWFGPPQLDLSPDRRTAAFTLQAGPPEALARLSGQALRVTLVDTDRAVEDHVTVSGPSAGD